MQTVFFYGLFMDQSLLVEQGFKPVKMGLAVLTDFRLCIAQRATLLPAENKNVMGVVMHLADSEVKQLYDAPSVRDYVPEQVTVALLPNQDVVEATCYNLPPGTELVGTDHQYAEKLFALATRLGLDKNYLDEIASFRA